ncbi:MAG: hypothetical protein U5O15_02845 [Candidatus Krumholzibacteriota bacterium]|nr:hypothetical protein [Candidatus Krumholzibacteriota bacterium]
MKKIFLVVFLVIVMFFSGCGSNHPSNIIVDPEFNPNDVSRILVTPVISLISDNADRNRLSERMTQKMLWKRLSRISDYKFFSPQRFSFALRKVKKPVQFDEIKKGWVESKTIDAELLKLINDYVDADLFLIPEVYLWNKDEADYRESSAASLTEVGVSIYLVNPDSGKILWEATDQNFMEAMRTEGERVMVRGKGGFDRRIKGISPTGSNVYEAPPFEDVLVKVLGALIEVFPSRSIVGK